ncbi:MAG: hypothetical protein R6X25_03570 [Candidatus Krumholzibacteriia bacterium]
MSTRPAVATRACRLLYYGAAGAGKRENLKQIIASVPAEHRLASGDGSGQEIAFLLRNGDQGDWRVMVRCVDLGREPVPQPGTCPDAPFDGIVFVVHSGVSRLDQSLSAFEGLKAFLDAWGRDLMSVPLVIQYNRREQQDTMPVDRLENLLNPWGLLSFPSSTAQREGVKETLKAILGLGISQVLQDDQERGAEAEMGSPDFDPSPPVPGTDHTPEPLRRPGAPESREANPMRLDGVVLPRRGSRDLSALAGGRGAFFDELRPPIVIPVRVPRSLIEKHGSVRILLEVEIDDRDPLLA